MEILSSLLFSPHNENSNRVTCFPFAQHVSLHVLNSWLDDTQINTFLRNDFIFKLLQLEEKIKWVGKRRDLDICRWRSSLQENNNDRWEDTESKTKKITCFPAFHLCFLEFYFPVVRIICCDLNVRLSAADKFTFWRMLYIIFIH